MTNESHELEGEWLPFKAELDGQAAPELVLTRTVLTVSAKRYVVTFAGETADRGSIAFGDQTPFPALQFTSTHGETDGRILPGIYQVRGDLLRLCFGINGVRPSEFSAPVHSERYFVLYRRKK